MNFRLFAAGMLMVGLALFASLAPAAVCALAPVRAENAMYVVPSTGPPATLVVRDNNSATAARTLPQLFVVNSNTATDAAGSMPSKFMSQLRSPGVSAEPRVA